MAGGQRIEKDGNRNPLPTRYIEADARAKSLVERDRIAVVKHDHLVNTAFLVGMVCLVGHAEGPCAHYQDEGKANAGQLCSQSHSHLPFFMQPHVDCPSEVSACYMIPSLLRV